MRSVKLWNDDDWGLFRDFDRLQGTMNQILSDFGRNYREGLGAFSPACDIHETAGHYVMSFDLPGLKREDIRIELEDNQLRVSGERKEEHKSDDSVGQRIERRYGSFERIFSLPSGVDADKIEADYQNGVLTLILPKAETAKARQIKVGESKGNILDRVFGRKPELKATADNSRS